MTFGISGSDYRLRPKKQTQYSWSAVPVPVSFGYYAEIESSIWQGIHGIAAVDCTAKELSQA